MESYEVEIERIDDRTLERLLHSSTIDTEDWFYASCVQTINEGDMLDKFELFLLLSLNQRDPFLECENITNKAIRHRLDFILLGDE